MDLVPNLTVVIMIMKSNANIKIFIERDKKKNPEYNNYKMYIFISYPKKI